MADPKDISPDPYISITGQLELQVRLAEQLIHRNRTLVGVKNLQKDIEKELFTTDQKIEVLNNSISAKMKEMLMYEEWIAESKRLGLGLVGGIVKEQRKIRKLYEEELALREKLQKSIDQQIAGMALMERTGMKPLVDRTKEFMELWKKDKFVPVAMIGFAFWKRTLEVFKSIDDAVAEFRMQMGLTRAESEGIYGIIQELTINLTQVGVTAKVAATAAFELSKALFTSQAVSYDLAENVSLMKAQLGVAEATSAEFLKSLGMINQTTAAAQVNMSYYAANLSKAAGVPIAQVMEDVNQATKESYQFISRSGVSLLKAAVEARRMGTNLQSATKTADALLNFTQNVKDEMEASVLVGKSINLQKARELAYHRDIRGLNQEILKIMKETDFENLDPFQQAAVAKALNKSAGELGQMAQAERQRLDMERSINPEIQKGLANYKAMVSATESVAKENGKNLAIQLRTQQNQARIAAITQTWAAITQKMSAAFLPAVLVVLEGINAVLDTIAAQPTLLKILGGVAGIAGGVALVVKAFSAIKFALFGIKAASTALGGGAAAGGGVLGGVFSGVSKALGKLNPAAIAKGALSLALLGGALWLFAKLSAPFAEINWKGMLLASLALAAVALVAGIMGSPPILGFILLGAVAIAALGLALIPFAAAAWIASKALQNLGEVKWGALALGILQLGLMSPLIGAMGLAMLVAAPGVAAFSLALIPLSLVANRAGAGMMSLGNGLKTIVESFAQLQSLSFISTIIQVKNLASAVRDLSSAINTMPDIKVEKLQSLLTAPTQAAAGGAKDNTPEMLTAIKEAIEGLRNDMKAGSLTANVYIDSQKLDSLMGRRLAYTGQLS